MSAGFAAGGMVALAGFSCEAWGAEAAMANNKHETARAIRTNERRKDSSEGCLSPMLTCRHPPRQLLPVIPPISGGPGTPIGEWGRWNIGGEALGDSPQLAEDAARLSVLPFPPCAKYFSYCLLPFHCRLF